MNLLDIIKNRPISGKDHICPYCDSKDVLVINHIQTTVGGLGEDPNHHWFECSCNSCKKNFTHELQKSNSWYTETSPGTRNTVVIKGVSSCFESYQYQCAKCDGPVSRSYTGLQGEPVTGLRYEVINGKSTPMFITRYTCSDCDHGGVVESERVT